MKKILSAILSLTMILALVAAMGITANAADLYDSAKDGDVLYEVNFKGDDKYSPAQFSVATENSIDVSVAEDGKSMTATYKAGVTKARAFFGGAIKGLTYGTDKQYTITMKIAVTDYINSSGKLTSNNAGVYINFPKNTDAQYLFDTGYKTLVGYYGSPAVRHSLSHAAGVKSNGKFISGEAYIEDSKYLATLDAEGFADLKFVVDGITVKLFINNVYFDEFDAFNPAMLRDANDLGFSAYLYNNEASITVKDVVIRKGIVLDNPTYPDYVLTGGEFVTGYEKAKTGDLLFAADFSRHDACFNTRFASGNGSKFVVTLDPNNPNYIKFEQDGSTAAAAYFGDVVHGLEINAETRYTTEWKVKTGAQNSGFCFIAPTNETFAKSYNLYGKFNTGNIATEHGSTKIENVNTPGKDYVAVSDMANDADGFAHLRVEMHGYIATIYYLNTEGKWVSYNQFDMRETKKFDGSATYSYPIDFQPCIAFYLHNKGLVAEYKDINIYKGLLISDPEGKLDPVVTEPAPEVTEPADPVPTGDSALVFAVIAVIALAGVAVVAKRREN